MIMFLNLFTDIYLLMIPIPMLIGAQIARARKAGLVVVFSGGIFVIVAGLLRSIFILQVCPYLSFLTSEFVPSVWFANSFPNVESHQRTKTSGHLGDTRDIRCYYYVKPTFDLGLDATEAKTTIWLAHLF